MAGHPAQPAGTLRPAEVKKLWRECRAVARLALNTIAGRGDELPPDLNIAIRTAQFCNGVARLQGGGGITARSSPAAEYEESLTKIRRILEAFAA